MSETLFAHVTYWHWWGFASILILFEAFAPRAFFFAPTAAAVFTGLLLLLFPGIGWVAQLLLFLLLSVAAGVGWHYLRQEQGKEEGR